MLQKALVRADAAAEDNSHADLVAPSVHGCGHRRTGGHLSLRAGLFKQSHRRVGTKRHLQNSACVLANVLAFEATAMLPASTYVPPIVAMSRHGHKNGNHRPQIDHETNSLSSVLHLTA
jgi:hypothetical protein